jgi:hypothetical protein
MNPYDDPNKGYGTDFTAKDFWSKITARNIPMTKGGIRDFMPRTW